MLRKFNNTEVIKIKVKTCQPAFWPDSSAVGLASTIKHSPLLAHFCLNLFKPLSPKTTINNYSRNPHSYTTNPLPSLLFLPWPKLSRRKNKYIFQLFMFKPQVLFELSSTTTKFSRYLSSLVLFNLFTAFNSIDYFPLNFLFSWFPQHQLIQV